ncbi:MAG TPA: hypothetical protein VFG69_07355 [Nannocystaceae bacterium]|nr:hypothetical protein [Nannocystaceae bacterium]
MIGPADADRIEWRAPAECPDDAAVEARVAAMLGPTDTAATRATADVSAGPAGYSVELTTFIDEAQQHRSLRATECVVLAEAVAVVVAVALDPVAVADRSSTPAPPPSTTAPPPFAVEPPAKISPLVVRTPPARTRRRWSFGSRIAGGYGLGTAPGGTGLVGLALYAETGRARLEIEGRWWAPRRIERGDFGARVLLGTASFAGCVQLGGPRVTAPLCIGLEAGALRAGGFGLTNARVVNFPWLAPLARAAIQVRVHARVRLWLAVEGAALALRPQLQQGFAQPQRFWAAPPVSPRVMLGVDARWTR